ncbi:hypothetical protein IEQ34_015013 [Dendrobium chrysotoxum]|uniref:Uncharacterized protein n=1 Tax=Dendrobium chrysotoxum TaxID=161865 RepID=A0AAV7GKV3_DENCH|nr:hypothetical protein IEQ34_015013 [Dendrobium chrysotoxum]
MARESVAKEIPKQEEVVLKKCHNNKSLCSLFFSQSLPLFQEVDQELLFLRKGLNNCYQSWEVEEVLAFKEKEENSAVCGGAAIVGRYQSKFNFIHVRRSIARPGYA